VKERDIEKCEFSEQCAAHGHMQLLKWGLEQTCLLDSETAFRASKNGHLEILKFVHSEKNCPLTEPCVLLAAKHGHVAVAKYLLGKLILNVQSDQIWNFASCSENSLEIMEYLAEKGFWREFASRWYVHQIFGEWF
jgi:hypothetical protein